jgi:hypothetical protein
VKTTTVPTDVGITITVKVDDWPDDDRYVLVDVYIDPPPPGLDRLAYSRTQKKVEPTEDSSRS